MAYGSSNSNEIQQILKKMNDGEELSREESIRLPDNYRQFYFLKEDAILEAPLIVKRRKKQALYAKRQSQREEEFSIYERALRKKYGNQELSLKENQIYKKLNEEIYGAGNPSQSIDLKAVDVLDDVIKGDYKLKDVNLARDGTNVISVESSPIQLLDKVVDNLKSVTKNSLQTSENPHFFQIVESNVLNRVTPLQLDNIISSCAAGI